MTVRTDALELSRALIRCPSVTPEDAGALDVLQETLEALGFTCLRQPFEAPATARVDNLYARIGTAAPNFCFAGHTDVVPPGDLADWAVDPFAAEIRDGLLFGRGACDMKTAIACFVDAAGRFLAARHSGFAGSISLLITGDEEGPAVNGTAKMLPWLAARGERLDACLVGEPTSRHALGDTVKVGRRGSLNAVLRVDGVQGHAAYPEHADNPIPRLVRMLAALDGEWLDHGTAYFQPSHLTVTSVDVGNPATNVIPARATAQFNVRFNDLHTAEGLRLTIEDRLAEIGPHKLDTTCSGEAFVFEPGPLSDHVSAAIEDVTGERPELGTGGGTSDARFIKDVCPVVEAGMLGATAHKHDECAAVADIERLTAIYQGVLERTFRSAG